MFGFLAFIVAIAAAAIAWRQHERLKVLEFDLEGLRKAFLAHREATAGAVAVSPQPVRSAGPVAPPVAAPAVDEESPVVSVEPAPPAPEAPKPAKVEPWVAAAARRQGPSVSEPPRGEQPVSEENGPSAPAAPSRPRKPDIETALGTRWAVWVGGLALALGGIFLVRYSIEAGVFGPEVRLTMAAVLGVVLAAGGEVLRRFGFRAPVEGLRNAHVPAILTAAGAFTLFGTVYAAHGVYGFIGPGAAFTLLGVIGVGTIALSLLHGQALGGIGVVGSYLTPLLVASTAPNVWALFTFVAVVLLSTAVIARMRDWALLMIIGFVGAGIWPLLYMSSDLETANLDIILFIEIETLLVLALVWLRGRVEGAALTVDIPAIAPALFVGLTAMILMVNPSFAAGSGPAYGGVLIAALVVVALLRSSAVTLLYAAGIAVVTVYARLAFSGHIELELWHGELVIDQPPGQLGQAVAVRLGAALSALLFIAGYWNGRRHVAAAPIRAASWTGWGTLAPLVVVTALWVSFGNLDRDFAYAAVALLLTLLFAAGGEWIARAEAEPRSGGNVVGIALAGATAAALLAAHMGLGSGSTTVAVGVLAVVPALATRVRQYPILGWLGVTFGIAVLFRIAYDPTIVGEDVLGRTPVFNWLLPGYGIPALATAFSAWQLARTADGRPRHVMEALAALFSLLAVAMLVRHAMNGGVIDTAAPTLAEQAIYTLIAIGGSAILIALDQRSPSPVFRYGSMAIGVISVAFIAVQHFIALDPLYTDESTGKIPFLNLLLLAYLAPAAAMAALALYARPRRPKWYVAMLALVAALLTFVYATLSLRRLFQGEFIGWWKGFSQLETYSYSALWLAMGVALLAAGVMLKSNVVRMASAALVVVAVAKVFLFDMSELEGVLRALSFIGLGAVLIGIGLFYQRMLSRAAASTAGENEAEPA